MDKNDYADLEQFLKKHNLDDYIQVQLSPDSNEMILRIGDFDNAYSTVTKSIVNEFKYFRLKVPFNG